MSTRTEMLAKETMVTCLMRAREDSQAGVILVNGAEDETFVSYHQLHQEAMVCLGTLQAQGLKPGAEVVFQLEDNHQYLILFWGCLLGKFIPVPLSIGNQDDHKHKLKKVWDNLADPFLVADAVNLKRIRTYAEKQSLTTWFDQLASRAFDVEEMVVGAEDGIPETSLPEDLAYIQFSSGSTGDPKGVQLTHRNLVFNTHDIAGRYRVGKQDKALSWMPLTHDMGLICFHLTSLVAGIRQYIMPTNLFIRRPLLWLEKASEHRVTQIYSPNFGYEYLMAALDQDNPPAWDLSTIRLIYNGAEPISSKAIDRFMNRMAPFGLDGGAMYPGYGLAEASVAVSLPEPGTPVRPYYVDRNFLQVGDQLREVDPTDERALSFVEVGYPIEHCAVRIAANDDAVLEENTVGNIQIKGENVTAGYYRKEEATAKVITPDGWIKTGDLGFMRNGHLVITGRAKNIIIINGQNYYPQDLERALEDIPGMETGKVVAASSATPDGRGEELLLFVLFKKRPSEFVPIVHTVRTRLAERIGLVPDKVIATRKIPKTTSGKIQNFQLVQQYQEGAFDEYLMELDSALAEDTQGEGLDQLVKLANTVAGTAISADDNLLAAGVSSLQAVRFLNLIRENTGLRPEIDDLFRFASLRALYQYLVTKGGAEEEQVFETPEQADYALTHTQRRVWVQCQAPETSVAFQLSAAAKYGAELDVDVLEQSLQIIWQRHEALRAVFFTREGEARQRFVSTNEVPFVLERRAVIGADTDVQHLLQMEQRRPMDLEQGPLIRAFVAPTAKGEYLFQFVVHHLVFDGWSAGVFFRELSECYAALKQGQSPDLTPVGGYRDFVHWEQQQLQAADLQKDRNYWMGELAGELPVLALPQPNTSAMPKGDYEVFTWPKQQFAELKSFTQQEGMTPFMTLMSLLQLLLHKYTGQNDLLVGTESAGRSHRHFEGMVGYFLNTLALRVQVEPSLAWRQLMRLVKNKLLAAYRHQQYPLDLAIEELGAKPGPQGLFDVLVLYQNFGHGLSLPELEGVSGEAMAVADSTTIVDLQLEFLEQEDTVQLAVRYNAARFSHQFVKDLFARLVLLAEQVVQQPDAPLADFSLLDDQQIAAAQDQYNPPATPREFMPLHAHLERSAKLHPKATALVVGRQRMSYAELNARANQLAFYLQGEYDLKAEDKVALLMERRAELLVTMLAVLKTGAAYVPVDVEYPQERQRYMLENSQARLVISDDPLAPELEEVAEAALPFNAINYVLESMPPANLEVEVAPSHLAYMLYTSGTTGQPKGVLIEHAAVSDYVATVSEYFALSDQDVVIQQASLAFDTHIEEIFPAWAVGATLVMLPEGGRDVGAMVSTIQTEKATVLSTTPLIVNELNRQAAKLPTLRILISGGDALKASYLTHLLGTVRVYNTYGPTESTVCATYHEVRSTEDAKLIGKPITNRAVYLLDSQGQLQAPGLVGEIALGGAGLARGYYQLPEVTAERFVAASWDADLRLYRTGDLGRWTEDGELEFLGRADDQLKIRGYRVELGEIEEVLAQCTGVHDAAVKAWGTAEDKYLVAYVVGEGTAETWRAHLASRLPSYMVPSVFEQMSELPLSPNGKTDKKRLVEPVRAALEAVAPTTALEKLLLEQWQQVLSREVPGIDASFFEHGGNSIKATQVMARLREQGYQGLSFADFFRFPTVRSMASQLRQGAKAAIAQVPDQQYYALTHAQRRLWMVQQLNPQETAFNLSWAFVIDGALQVDRLKLAFEGILNRHEPLRTRFVLVGDEPKMEILPLDPQGDWWQVEKLSGDATLESVLAAESRTPFALDQAPLLRVKILQWGANQAAMVLSIHHLVADGWSMQVMMRELQALYTEGDQAQLPELSVRYRDVAAHRNAAVEAESSARHRNYWNDLLSEVPHLTWPRREIAEESQSAGLHFHALPADLVDRLKNFATESEASLFHVLLAGWQAVLHRYTQQTDLVVGTDAAGRDQAETENLVGYFLHELVIRTQLDTQWDFKTLVKHVQERALASMEHQAYPYDQDHRGESLFEVLFLMQNFQDGEYFTTLSDDLKFEAKDLPAHRTFADLVLECFEEAEGNMRVKVRHDLSKLAEDTVAEMLQAWEALMDAWLQEPKATLLAAENSAADAAWSVWGDRNQTSRERSFKPLPQQVAQKAQQHPEAVAIVCRDQRLTYAQLESQIDQVATALRQSYQPGDRVGLLMPRSEKLVVAMLSSLKAGITYLPLDPDFPQDRLAYMAEDSNLAAIITEDDTTAPGWWPGEKLLTWSQLGQGSSAMEFADAAAQDLAYLIYTSGSTGKPKGVMISQGAMTDYVQTVAEYFALSSADVAAQQSSVSFDTLVEEVFPVLTVGGTLVILPEGGRDVVAMREAIQREQVTFLSTTPLVLGELNQTSEGLQSLRTIISGGDVLRAQQIDKLLPIAKVYNTYGPSESTVCATYHEVKDLAQAGWIGTPITNREVYVLDEAMQPVPDGVLGELYLGGAGLAEGYLNRPEETAARFVAHPRKEGQKLYRTGDLVRWLPQQCLEFVGRADDQLKVRGYRIELGEIAQVLAQQPEVLESHVDVWGQGAEKSLVAYYCGAAKEAQLRTGMAKQLPPYMVPSHFVVLETMPLGPTGKLDRKALPQPATGGADYQAPQTPQEEQLAALWSEVLGQTQVGRSDNFFALGGHSLKATQLLNKLRQGIAPAITLKDIFAHPVLSDLAMLLPAMEAKPVRAAIQPIPTAEQYPASQAQKRMWILHQLDEQQAAYNINLAYTVRGAVQPELLQQALVVVQQRHESLRTVFSESDGAVFQHVRSAADQAVKVQVLDLRDFLEKEMLMIEIARDEARQPFNLEEGPLWRVALARKHDQEYVFMLSMHHIISDGWSTGQLVSEILAVYAALNAGQEPKLQPLAIQYKDYAAFRDQQVAKDELADQREFWKAQFADAAPVLELPTDHKRPENRTFEGTTFDARFSQAETQALHSLSQEHGATLFMTLMATVYGWLYRYSGQEDLVVGTPVAGRNYAGLEEQIGLYVNTLALRAQPKPTDTLADLLKKTKATASEAFDNQDYPFDFLVDDLGLARDLSRSPLYDVMVVLLNTEPTQAVEGLESEVLRADSGISKFDLNFDFEELDGQLELRMQFSDDLFEPATMYRMLQHYMQFVKQWLAMPRQSLFAIDFLTPQERKELLVWNKTATQLPDGQVVTKLEEQVYLHPEAIALEMGDDTWTYQAFNERVNQLAHALQSQFGISAGDRVGIMLPRSADLAMAIWGVVKAGGAYVPIDPTYPTDRIEYLLEDSGIKALVVDALPEGVNTSVPVLSPKSEAIAQQPTTNPEVAIAADQPAYAIYTSGTTGKPKGVLVSHQALFNLVQWLGELVYAAQPRKGLLTASVNFDASIQQLFTPLCFGSTLVMLTEDTRRDVGAYADLLVKSGVEVIDLTPSFLSVLLAELEGRAVKPPLTTTLVGGEALEASLTQQYHRVLGAKSKLINVYGVTEAAVDSTFEVAYDHRRATTIGKPIPNTQLHVLDANLMPMGPGRVGQLAIGGVGVAMHYLNRPELTTERFLDRTILGSGDRWYLTGDLARWTSNGSLEFLGRMDRQVKLRGYRIELGEIESTLMAHDGIAQAYVKVWQDQLVAYYRPASEATEDALRGFMQDRLPAYMVPGLWHKMDQFPTTPSGKVDEKALPEPVAGAMVGDEKAWLPDANGLAVMEIWQTVLGRESVSPDDNFFALGGQSLKAMMLASRLSQHFGVKVPLREIFNHQTPRTLTQYLQGLSGGSLAKLQPTPKAEHYPLSDAQMRLYIAHQKGEGRAYHMPSVYTLSGQLDVEALMRAYQALVDRHEILRTVFVEVEGEPRQKVLEQVMVELPILDAKSLSEEQINLKIQSIINRPFAINEEPLIRMELIQVKDQEWKLIFVLHHLISDGYSAEIILNNLVNVYQVTLNVIESSLVPLEVHYKDYAVYQKKWKQTPEYQDSKAFWLDQLNGGIPALGLPRDFAGTDQDILKSGEKAIILYKDEVKPILDYCLSLNITLHSILNVWINVFLCSLKGSMRSVVNIPVAGRDILGLEDQVGFYVNTLPIVLEIDPEKSFKEVLSNGQEVIQKVLENQSFPVEQLIEDHPHLKANQEVLLVFDPEAKKISVELDGLTVKEESVKQEEAKYDIAIYLAQEAGDITGTVRYRSAYYAAERMEQFVNDLKGLWMRLMTNPDAPLKDVMYVTDEAVQTNNTLDLDLNF